MALGINASPLSCGSSIVTISATNIQETPSRWGVFLFYKAVYSATPFYSGPLKGNFLNPATDTKWEVYLPMDADYYFYCLALLPNDPTVTFGLDDWTFNPVDGRIYVSLSSGNVGNPLDNQVYWKGLDQCDYQKVPLKTLNVAANTLERASLLLSVTGNSTFLGLDIKTSLSGDTSVQTLAIKDCTGDFSFSCNPNGYGGVNPYRGDYAQMAILTNTKSDGTFTEYAARPYNYRSALKYYFDIPRDGVYTLNIFLVQVFGNMSYYNNNQAVFEDTTNAFYVSLKDNNTDPVTNAASWAPISGYAYFSSTAYYKKLTYAFMADGNGKKLLYDISQGIKTSCPCAFSANSKCGDDLAKKYSFVLQQITAACFAVEIGRYSDAQCFLERIPKNCAPYVSAYKC